MRSVLARGAAAVALVAAAAGCGTRTPVAGVSIEWRLSSQPPTVGPASLTFVLSDAAARPLEGARLSVEGNMSHAGMAPVFATAADLGDGRYRAPLDFTMAGDWVLLVSGELPDGRKVEHRIDVAGVRPAT